MLSFPVRADPAWCLLQDLQLLRNIIVHRGGEHGESPEQQKIEAELLRTYPKKMQLQKTDGIHEQIWVSMNLCREFARSIDEFFERIFKSAGLSNRHMQLDT